MKLAYFSPLNPVRSGISDYSEELLPLLADRVDRIDLFIGDYQPANPIITSNFTCHHHDRFDELNQTEGYDLAIYQQGNNSHHEYVYRHALKHPGLVVLHDYVLHHLITEMTLARDDHQGYVDLLHRNHGPFGTDMAEGRLAGVFSDLQHFLYPASWHLTGSARGVIVHSRYLLGLLRNNLPQTPVQRVAMGMTLPAEGVDDDLRRQARADLGLPADALIAGSFGFVTPMKRLDLGLKAFARFSESHNGESRFLVVGEVSPACRLEPLVKSLGLEDRVVNSGFVGQNEFQTCLAAVDLALNLRYPTAGETSASLLRVMGMGIPVVVPRYRQYNEFPADAAMHLPLDGDEEEHLVEILRRLADDEEGRRRLGRNAREYVRQRHTLEEAADGYLQFFKRILAGKPPKTLIGGKDDRGWYGGGNRPPAGTGPCPGDSYFRNSRVPGRLHAFIRLQDRYPTLLPGAETEVRLSVRNTGDTVWLATPNTYGGYVVLAARIFDHEDRPAGREQAWQPLPYDLEPGDAVEIECPVKIPSEPGRYGIRFDLLDVGIGWFLEGREPAAMPGFDTDVR